MTPSRTCGNTQHILPGSWLAAAATVWLALAAVWPARANPAPGEEGNTRTYTLAEKTIRRAQENLPKQVSTESPELTSEEQSIIRRHYPELFASDANAK